VAAQPGARPANGAALEGAHACLQGGQLLCAGRDSVPVEVAERAALESLELAQPRC